MSNLTDALIAAKLVGGSGGSGGKNTDNIIIAGTNKTLGELSEVDLGYQELPERITSINNDGTGSVIIIRDDGTNSMLFRRIMEEDPFDKTLVEDHGREGILAIPINFTLLIDGVETNVESNELYKMNEAMYCYGENMYVAIEDTEVEGIHFQKGVYVMEAHNDGSSVIVSEASQIIPPVNHKINGKYIDFPKVYGTNKTLNELDNVIVGANNSKEFEFSGNIEDYEYYPIERMEFEGYYGFIKISNDPNYLDISMKYDSKVQKEVFIKPIYYNGILETTDGGHIRLSGEYNELIENESSSNFYQLMDSSWSSQGPMIAVAKSPVNIIEGPAQIRLDAGTYALYINANIDGSSMILTLNNVFQEDIIKIPSDYIDGIDIPSNIETTTNKVTSISSSSSNVRYPSAKAVYTYAEAKANKVTSLSSSSTDTQYPSAKLVYSQLTTKEATSNKSTSISSASTNTQYPSAKAVYDYAETKASKTNSISSSSTNTEYPSAKAVYTYGEAKANKTASLSSASTNTQYPTAKAVYDYMEAKANKTTLISSSSTDIQYPSAKAVYDYTCVGIESENCLENALPDYGVDTINATYISYLNGILLSSATSSCRGGISSNGETWDYINYPRVGNGWEFAFINNKYVGVTRSFRDIIVSDNGKDWITYSDKLPNSFTKAEAICFSGSIAVIIQNGSDKSAYSTDGINWTQTDMPASRSWYDVCYGNNKFVAIAYNSDKGAYSVDGINWIEMNMPASRAWGRVIYENNKFIAISDSDKGAYSTDGVTWTEMSMPTSRMWMDICYGNNTFVAVARGSSKGAYSTDGITWTEMNMPENREWINWFKVFYINSHFVAISNEYGDIATSVDGILWTYSNNKATLHVYPTFRNIYFGNGKYIGAANSKHFYYSSDGITWNVSNDVSNYASYWNSICYGNGKYVAIAQSSSKGAYSVDGITWTGMNMPAVRTWIRVAYGNNKFVAIASDSNKGAYSTDGINWIEMDMPENKSWTSLCYGNNKFVAVGYGASYSASNKGAYSTDGINWIEMNMSGNRFWMDVCYGNNKFVAVNYQNSGRFSYSEDGITWTDGVFASGNSAIGNVTAVCSSENGFFASYTSSSWALYSSDGITWYNMPLIDSSPSISGRKWAGCVYGEPGLLFYTPRYVGVTYSGSNEIDAVSTTGLLYRKKIITIKETDVTSDFASAVASYILPTPTIADIGKVLGVDSNGKLAYITIGE